MSNSFASLIRPHLPVRELNDLIIDEFRDDFPTLRICSLVSHAWRERTRVHLFHDTILTLSAQRQFTSTGLYSILTDSPHLASSIRDLTIQGIPQDLWWESADDISHQFSKLLPLLTNLRYLQLKAPHDKPTVIWANVMNGFKDGVKKLLQLPALSSFTISHVTFATGLDLNWILLRALALKRLVLENIAFSVDEYHKDLLGQIKSNTGAENSLPPAGNILLDELVVTSTASIFALTPDLPNVQVMRWLHFLNCPLNLKITRSLKVAIHNAYQPETTLMLKKIGHSLEFLHALPCIFVVYPGQHCRLDLSHNSGLRTLLFDIGEISIAQQIPSRLPSLLHSLSTLAPSNSLEVLKLKCRVEWADSIVYPSSPSLSHLEEINQPAIDWKSFAEVLAGGDFQILRKLEIDFSSDRIVFEKLSLYIDKVRMVITPPQSKLDIRLNVLVPDVDPFSTGLINGDGPFLQSRFIPDDDLEFDAYFQHWFDPENII